MSTLKRNCISCGKEFSFLESSLRWRKNIFCSHQCANKVNMAKKKGIKIPYNPHPKQLGKIPPTAFKKGSIPWNAGTMETVKTNCLTCDKEIISSVVRVANGRGRFCSASCRGKYFNGDKASNWQGGLEIPRCLDCGKLLSNRNNKYCQKHAHVGERGSRWIANKIKNTCIDCGIEISNKSKKCFLCSVKDRSGEKSVRWKGGITPFEHAERVKFRNTIQKKVLERDGYTCQMCGKSGVYLHVDHIQEWSKYVEGRFDMDNCRTLCLSCHYKITFGKEMPEGSKWGITSLMGRNSN